MNEIDGLVHIKKGERIKIQFYGYIDPEVLVRDAEQPQTKVLFAHLQIFTVPDFMAKTKLDKNVDAEMQQRLQEYSNAPFAGF